MTTMAKTKKMINFAARMKKQHKLSIPLFIWGKHGIGKTEAVTQVANSMNYNCQVLNLANQSPEELLGMPKIEGDLTVYKKPEWLASSNVPTIYFLDEINRAPKYVLQGMMNFILSGRLHTHNIGPDDIVIAAGNPETDEYDVTCFDDKAFLSRFGHIYFEPTVSELLTHMNQIKCSDIICDVVKESIGMFNDSVDPKDMIKVEPTRRNITKIGLMLNHMTPEEVDDFGYELFNSFIGSEITPIILNKYKEVTALDNPETIITNGIKSLKVKADEIDKINVLNSRIAQCMVTNYPVTNWNKQLCTNVVAYLNYIPKDVAVSFLKELTTRSVSGGTILEYFKYEKNFIVELMTAKNAIKDTKKAAK